MGRPKKQLVGKLIGEDEVVRLPDGTEATIASINRSRWLSGIGLETLLSPVQQEFEGMRVGLPPYAKMFVEASRKLGKSWWLFVVMIMVALRKQGAVCRLAVQTKTQANEIYGPLSDEILETCPADLRPTYADGVFSFRHRGSRIILAGTDSRDQIERLRGPKADVIGVDEIGSHDCDLDYVLRTVLQPQLMKTGGNILITGTPPESMDHQSNDIREQMQLEGRLIRKTIWDDPGLTREQIAALCREANQRRFDEKPEDHDARLASIMDGKEIGTPSWEREYLCRQISDESQRVTPEFSEAAHVSVFRPPYWCDKYVFLDPGHAKDYFAGTFGFLDYSSQKFVVQRDYHSKRKPTDEVLKDLRRIEAELWPVTRAGEALIRVADGANAQQITDFASKGYFVQPSPKSPGKELIVVELKNRLNALQIIIDPGCENLIGCLRDGLFRRKQIGGDSAKLDFRRTPRLGHLDSLDALATGLQSGYVRWNHNPAPPGFYNQTNSIALNDMHLKPQPTEAAQALKRVYQLRAVPIGRY